MRKPAFPFLLVLCLHSHAGAEQCTPDTLRNKPCTPGAAAKNNLKAQSRKVRGLLEDWLPSFKAEKTLHEKIKNEEELRKNRKGKLSEDEFTDLYVEWKAAYITMNGFRDDLQKEGNKLLEETAAAYHVDHIPTERIRGGPSKDVPVVSKILFQPEQDHFLSTSKDSRNQRVHVALPAEKIRLKEGATAFNGQIIINMKSIDRAIRNDNPGEIAVYILHEVIHRNSLTDGGWYGGSAGEIEPYGYTDNLIRIFELDKNDQTTKTIRERLVEAVKDTFKKDKVGFIKRVISTQDQGSLFRRIMREIGVKEEFPTSDHADLYEELGKVYAEQRRFVKTAGMRITARAERRKKENRKKYEAAANDLRATMDGVCKDDWYSMDEASKILWGMPNFTERPNIVFAIPVTCKGWMYVNLILMRYEKGQIITITDIGKLLKAFNVKYRGHPVPKKITPVPASPIMRVPPAPKPVPALPHPAPSEGSKETKRPETQKPSRPRNPSPPPVRKIPDQVDPDKVPIPSISW